MRERALLFRTFAIILARAGHDVLACMRNLVRGGELRAATAKENLPLTIVQLSPFCLKSLATIMHHP
jgi:hypothetical protein